MCRLFSLMLGNFAEFANPNSMLPCPDFALAKTGARRAPCFGRARRQVLRGCTYYKSGVTAEGRWTSVTLLAGREK
jgi:hypothetical protein